MGRAGKIAVGILLTAVASGCDQDAGVGTQMQASERLAPTDWVPVVIADGASWSADEAAALNDALYLVDSTLGADDPRRELLRKARYVPFDQWKTVEGPPLQDSEAVFSLHTGNIYVERPTASDVARLATTLAHELHHMERDRTRSVNRMQEVDRERVAHAREAEDAGRMTAALRERPNSVGRVRELDLAQAKAEALSAMYGAKLELFRLVQVLDGVDGLRDMPDLYRAYDTCMALAQAKLSTDHGPEHRALEALSSAARGTLIEGRLRARLEQASGALASCARLQSKVDALRKSTGQR